MTILLNLAAKPFGFNSNYNPQWLLLFTVRFCFFTGFLFKGKTPSTKKSFWVCLNWIDWHLFYYYSILSVKQIRGNSDLVGFEFSFGHFGFQALVPSVILITNATQVFHTGTLLVILLIRCCSCSRTLRRGHTSVQQ